MRRDNPFKRECMVLGNISDTALSKGVTIRPYSSGVILHVEVSFAGIEARLDGEEYVCCFPSVLALMKDLEGRLKSGKYLFLWHSMARDGADVSGICAKKALLGQQSNAGFALSPLKKNGEPWQTLEDIKADEWPVGETKKMKLLKWNKVAGQKDFKRQLDNIYKRGYISAVVRVGKKVYRVCKIEEEYLKIVGFVDSTRWNEVGGILVEVPGVSKPVEVKRGLSTFDKRDMYNDQDGYIGTNAVVQHEGLTTKKTLRNSKVRALRVTVTKEEVA